MAFADRDSITMPVCIPLLLRLTILESNPGDTKNFNERGCLFRHDNSTRRWNLLRQRLWKIAHVLEKEEMHAVVFARARAAELTHPDQCHYSDDEWNKYFASSNFLYDAAVRLRCALEPPERTGWG